MTEHRGLALDLTMKITADVSKAKRGEPSIQQVMTGLGIRVKRGDLQRLDPAEKILTSAEARALVDDITQLRQREGPVKANGD